MKIFVGVSLENIEKYGDYKIRLPDTKPAGDHYCEKRHPLPFDIKDLPVIYYDRLNLKETLEPKLDKWVSSVKINK